MPRKFFLKKVAIVSMFVESALTTSAVLILALALCTLGGCDRAEKFLSRHSVMAPNPNMQQFETTASVTRDSTTGDYVVTWTSEHGDALAMIAVQTSPEVTLVGDDVVAVAVQSPYVWAPRDPSAEYFFAVMPSGGTPVFAISADESVPAD